MNRNTSGRRPYAAVVFAKMLVKCNSPADALSFELDESFVEQLKKEAEVAKVVQLKAKAKPHSQASLRAGVWPAASSSAASGPAAAADAPKSGHAQLPFAANLKPTHKVCRLAAKAAAAPVVRPPSPQTPLACVSWPPLLGSPKT